MSRISDLTGLIKTRLIQQSDPAQCARSSIYRIVVFILHWILIYNTLAGAIQCAFRDGDINWHCRNEDDGVFIVASSRLVRSSRVKDSSRRFYGCGGDDGEESGTFRLIYGPKTARFYRARESCAVNIQTLDRFSAMPISTDIYRSPSHTGVGSTYEIHRIGSRYVILHHRRSSLFSV